MTMPGRLAKHVALITGGGGEIGSAIARRFAEEGAAVAVADLDPSKSEATARSLGHAGKAHALHVDVADPASAEAAVRSTVEAFGRLTTLVNVAATVTPEPARWRQGQGVLNGSRHLLNRPGEPEEVAAGAAYLASDDASFVTATDLLIDGGYVAFKGRVGEDGRISFA